MTVRASVERDGKLRLFVAFRLPESWLLGIAAWQREYLVAPSLRVAPATNLHVTVAFLGSRPRSDVGSIVETLRDAHGGAACPVVTPIAYRELQRAAVLVLDDECDRARDLQQTLGARLFERGLFTPERRPWLPHVAVARMRGSRPRLAPPLPAVGVGCLSELALYSSVLRPSGAEYEVLNTVELR
ncbi:MAG: 2'-5' RNA ligase family protein [Gaiellales bacterium]